MQQFIEQLRTALRSIWFYRWWGVWAAFAVAIVGTVVIVLMPNKYEASARVYVDTQSILKPLMTGITVQPDLEQQVAMMSRTLLSRPNLERVARMSDLDLNARNNIERSELIDGLAKNIQFQPARGVGNRASNLYLITYRNTSSASAQRVVQSLLSIFVESNLGDKRRDSDQARRFIDEQIKTYEVKLLKAEEALKNFKIANISQMPNLAQSYEQRVAELQNTVSQARLELRQAESSRAAISAQLRGEKPVINTSVPLDRAPPIMATSELQNRVDAQRRRLAELRTRFTEAHPDVSEGARVLDQLERQLEAERRAEATRPPAAVPSRIVEIANPVYEKLRVAQADIESLVASARAKLADSEMRLAQAREAAATIPKVEAEYTQLTRDYDVNKRSYEELLKRRESAQISGDMDASANVAEFRVVDPPRVAPEPVWPNRPLLIGLLFLGSLSAGIAAPFMREQIRPTFFDANTLRAVAGRPLLGAVSLVANAASIAKARRDRLALSGVSVAYVAMFIGLFGFYWLRYAAK